MSLISGRMFRKALHSKVAPDSAVFNSSVRNKQLLTADSSPMPTTHAVQAELKLNGPVIPFDFLVVEKLGYDTVMLTRT